MNQSRFMGLLFCAGLFMILPSCGGGGNEKSSMTDSAAAADSAAKANAAANTIITTPQNMVVVEHKVANYEKWLAAYEGNDSVRLANGLHSYVIGRGLLDSNMVLVALKIDDTAKAKAFSMDPNTKRAMKAAGVVGTTTISIVTVTWQDTVKLETKIRSEARFTVKDWDAFLKAFADGKQERMDNGITARVIGHDLDDNKKILLTTAITDTAKAFAYYKSDALKKRRQEGGVIGETVRFVFRIVKRY